MGRARAIIVGAALLFGGLSFCSVAHAAPGMGTDADLRPILAWVFATIGLYHLALWNRLRPLREYLWFGLVALCLGLNAHITGGGFDDLPREAYTRVLPANFHVTAGLFPLFVFSVLGRARGRAMQIHVGANLVLAVFMLAFGTEEVFTAMRPVRLLALLPMATWALLVTVVAAFRGHPEGRVIAIAGVPMFVAAARDRWVELQGVVGQGWSSAAFGVFILGMAFLLADRSGRAYNQVQARETELAALNAATKRFVPFRFLQLLGKKDIREVELGEGIEREISVVFSDIRAFTSLSEKMTPRESFGFINAYLGHMEPCVEAAGGFIDKYIGDAVMALFPGGPGDAVRASLAMLRALEDFNAERAAEGLVPIDVGIGVNTGACMLGTIGGPTRMDGTVISDAVNLAARVESMTKRYGARVVVTHATAKGLGTDVVLREVDRVAVKGKSQPVALFEVLDGEPPGVREGKLASADAFAQALLDFRSRRFDVSSAGFRRCLETCPDDGAAALYLGRCAWLAAHDPGPEWDGVVRMAEK
jgi:class 3 adenylate cyclase